MSFPEETKYKFFQIFVIGLIALVSVLALFTISSAVTKKGPMAGGIQSLEHQATAHPAVEAGFEDWQQDADGYAAILDSPDAETKPQVVYFYAPWCPYCKRFHSNILTQSQVQAYLKNFSKVRIYPDQGRRAEQTLMAQFGAQGFPTFYVKFPGQAGFTEVPPYAENGQYLAPEGFIASLEAIRRQTAGPEAH